jgi:hypothetical protein
VAGRWAGSGGGFEDWGLRQRREQHDRENWLKTELLILLCKRSYYYFKVMKCNFMELGATQC